jgi:protein TonB
MSRSLIIAVAGSLLLHAGFFFGGNHFKPTPAPAPAKEEIPVVELAPLPPVEPDPVTPEVAAPAPADVSDLAPPTQADVPSAAITSPFVQQLQPPPVVGISRSQGIVIPAGRPVGAPAGLGNIFDLASLDQRPVLTVRINPAFPSDMKRAGISGEVVLGFVVDSEGVPRDVVVLSASRPEFEAEAVKAILKWRFKPGRKGGAAVNTRMQQPLSFTIKN